VVNSKRWLFPRWDLFKEVVISKRWSLWEVLLYTSSLSLVWCYRRSKRKQLMG